MPKTPFRYFKESEVKGLDITLILRLDRARGLAGVPFIITSGFRTQEENKRVGGVADSSHLKGLAVDLQCKNSKERYAILSGLIYAGFERIEICKDHIHTDIDKNKENCVIWLEY